MSIIDIHLIHSLAPNNVNRDETGAPKTCVFGGVQRRRVSSQSWKRAIRSYFRDVVINEAAGLQENHLGIRTRRVPEQVGRLLTERGRDAAEASARTLKLLGLKGADDQSAVLLFISREEIAAIADAVDEQWDALGKDGKPDPVALGQGRALDLALFGRMLAELPGNNIDAACRVAHAISTHRADTEIDFFTAIDDLKGREEDAGAGMMGDLEFSSCTLYRHVALDTEQLLRNLGDDKVLARAGTAGLLEAVVRTVPGGKQTTFLSVDPPSLVLVDVRGAAVGLANAFAKPVAATRELSIVDASIAALAAHRSAIDTMYGTRDIRMTAVCALSSDETLGGLASARVPGLDELREQVVNAAFPGS
jgi:CRISPR system Cascade subunit CasC